MSNIKYNLKIAKEIFKKENCELMEEEYKNSKYQMKYKCSCGNESKISLYDFIKGGRCKECHFKKVTFSYEYVYNYFKENNCLLLSENYINSKQKLKYKCSCGNISYIEFRNFKRGMRCKICSIKRSEETNKENHGGKLYFQTEEFKKDRENIFMKKYGVKNPSQYSVFKEKKQSTYLKKYGYKEVLSSPDIFKKTRETLKAKYGYEYIMQIPIFKEKFKKTLLERYGVPSLAYLSKSSSKESQKLFNNIYKKMDKKYKDKTYFASLNQEFTIKYNNKYFKYDFVNSKLKKAIEYNGNNFHPKDYQKDNEVRWCAFHPDKTVKEAKDYEKIKYEGLEKRGYTILTVWDYEFHQDFNILLNRCLDFLRN